MSMSPTSLHGHRAIENTVLLCHEANRGYCESLGDTSQKPWAQASEHQVTSCRDGVMKVLRDPETAPGESHQSWLKFKLEQGWKVGPIKSEEKKEHPSMVPFEKLPVAEQAKDHIFVAVAQSSLSAYGTRTAYEVKPYTGDIGPVRWKCTDERFTIGMLVVHGRAARIAASATTAMARAYGYPVQLLQHQEQQMERVYADIAYCMASASPNTAYDNMRANAWPTLHPPLGDTRSREDWQLRRSYWYVIHAIARAVMEIEGVKICAPPWRRRWVYGDDAIQVDVTEASDGER